MVTSTDAYAVCNTCGRELVDREAMSQHMAETMTPTGNTFGITARGHSATVVNPTPEEAQSSRLRSVVAEAVADATERACEALDRRIERGDITTEQVADELKNYPDFADAWAEWVADGAS